MTRYAITLAALTCHVAAVPQALTLKSLKGPIAKAGGTVEAKSIPELWTQIFALKPPVPDAPSGPPYFTAAQRAANLSPAYLQPNGSRIPPSADPDTVGAFRFICTAGPLNYDDAIVYPGQIGGSPHLHQNYGNTLINGKSTHENLLAAGDSTCSNALNRSAYWVPALITSDGKNVIVPDWVNIYYKRLPASAPECLQRATKGCAGLPVGLRVLSGFDMKRMGEAQPENRTYHFRCAENSKPSIERPVLAQAVADCGTPNLPVQIVAQINFPDCWNGELDSPDHRKHLAWPVWDNGNSGTPWPGPCPKSHPYLIPHLAQLVAFTIAPGDGDIHFASDRMAGMPPMPGGSTFHADYIEAWDPQTRETWEANCINKKLNCSDGVLGDGTMMRRGDLTYKANPRLVPVPARPVT